MENYRYVPNVNLEEKEVSKKDLEFLSKKLVSLKDNLNEIRNTYNESEYHFPDDKDFLGAIETCGLAVTLEVEKIKMEIVKKVVSVSDHSGVN